MKVDQLKAGCIISYLQMGISVLIGLVYTPIMLKYLGQSEYGLYNTVASTISMLSILSLGFNSSYIRYYSKYKKDNNRASIDKLNGLFLIIFIIIGLIAFLCGIFLSFNLELVFDEGLTSAEYETAKILMLLLTVNLAVSFPMSVFISIISAHERYVFLKLLNIFRTVLGPMVTLPLLIVGFRSIAMVVVTVVISFTVDLIYLIYVLVVLKSRFVFHDFEKGLFGSLFTYTAFIAINLIVNQINWNVDKMLLGRFIGTGAVAVYSVGFYLYQYYEMFSTSISGVFTPRIHKIINTTDDLSELNMRLTDLFVKVGRIQFLILALVSSGIIFFGKEFIYFWAGAEYDEAYYVALLLVIPASVPLIQNVGIEIQRAENKHWFRSIAYLIMAVINLILSIYLCKLYGVIGSATGTSLSLVLANGLVMNIYYHKKCNINIIKFWQNILRMGIGLIIPIIFGNVIHKFFELETVWSLVVGIISYSLVYMCSMWLFGMNSYEKNLMKVPVRTVWRRFMP